MKKILHIISSINGAQSFSIQLGNAIVDKIIAANPGSTVKETNLVDIEIPHLGAAQFTAFFTPAESRTPQDLEAIKYSDEAVKDLLEADVIVIGSPLYNFGIPSTLKAWIEHIVRRGITFSYGENGPVGLVTGKKVYIAVASGGVYSEGPMQAYDFAVPYLKTVLGVLGVTDVDVFRVEGTNVPGVQEGALEKGINSIVL